MGILSGILGNASTISTGEAEQELKDILIPQEQVDAAFKLVRDLIVFTSKRLIIVDKQGLTGKKIDYHSLPYKSISHFSIETSGHFDLDSELKIWISGAELPAVSKQFRKDNSVLDIQKLLAAICM